MELLQLWETGYKYRLPRALERRSDESPRCLQCLDLGPDSSAERLTDGARLLTPTRVEGNVELSLQPILGVIRRLAVAHEDEAMRKFRHAETIPLKRLSGRFGALRY